MADCFHCGLPVADPTRWTVLINHINQPMCCPGCQAVAASIVGGGFENYYQFRSELAPKGDAEPGTSDRYGLIYDDPILQNAFINTTNGMSEIQLYIEGIHCAACCWLIEHALQNKKGVEQITVNLSSHKALLRWDRQQHKLSELLQCIHDVGYQAQPYQQNVAEQAIRQENRRQLLRLGIAGIGMMQAMMFALALYAGDFSGIDAEHKQFMRFFSLLVTLPVMFYSAAPFFSGAWRNIRNWHAGMDVPVSIALVIAFVASVHAVFFKSGEVYFDSISMFVFLLLLARFAEQAARQRFPDASSVNALGLSCECARETEPSYRFENIAVRDIRVGQFIRVRAGQTIPLDGIVVDGHSSVNESAFSGEQATLAKNTGDTVLAGTINGDGVLIIRVASASGDTRLDIISRLSEWSQAQKPRVNIIADKLASVFTVLVLLLATAAGLYWYGKGSAETLPIVLSILVVSCPCALSLATPSAMASSYQALRKRGLLVTSTNIIEQTRHISRVIFDKTGTLTQGKFSISATKLLTTDKKYTLEMLLELSAALERYSEHPVATAFKSIATDMLVTDVRTCTGKGVEGKWQGENYRIGSPSFCSALAGTVPTDQTASVYLVKQDQWLASFNLQDEVRPDAQLLVDTTRESGMQVEIVSGDSSGAAEELARQLGIAHCHSHMSPENKLAYITALQAEGQHVMMVGDGINDIPVLAKANVSVAMNNASDLAKIQADAILLNATLSPIMDLINHSAKTRTIIFQNILWALLYNALALPAAAMGLVEPWQAALGMSMSSLWVTFNSLRLHRI